MSRNPILDEIHAVSTVIAVVKTISRIPLCASELASRMIKRYALRRAHQGHRKTHHLLKIMYVAYS